MREFEYIAYGIEHMLVDELVGVICQESLESKPYPDGFRRIFDNYRLLRQSFWDKSDEYGKSDFSEAEIGDIVQEFQDKRNQFLEAFLVEIESNYPELEIRQLASGYLKNVCSGDVVTTENRVCIYPYLVSQARLFDERKYENGNHN